MAALKQLRALGLFTGSKGAFFTASRQRFQTQWGLWRKELPGITPYYAVKCNPDPRLLQWHVAEGGAFDCASAREMELVCPERADESVLFANPCKTIQDINIARKKGVQWVTADSVEELQKMYLSIYRPSVLLRVAVDDSAAACPFSSKFGLPLENLAAMVEEAKNRVIPVRGVSFHVGSGNGGAEAFGNAIQDVMAEWNRTQDRMETLDIGGGWSADAPLFQQQAASARSALATLSSDETPCQVIAEPGRFFAAPVYDLYVRVMGKKPARNGKGYRYTLDESLYGQFSCVPFDHATPPMYRVREPHDAVRRRVPATFFGRTCDSLDIIAKSDDTEELFVGDWLYVPSMGAYTVATSTEFNGFPKPDIVETNDQPDSESLVACRGLSYPFAHALKTI